MQDKRQFLMSDRRRMMDYAIVLYMNEEKTAMVNGMIRELAVYDLN